MSTLHLPLTREEIEARIPHRAPILLLDEVLEWHPDTTLTAQRVFPETDPLFRGHFPGQPILPGVLTVEAIAQAAALHTSLSKGLTAHTAGYLFMGIEKATFRKPVQPNDTLILRITKQAERMGVLRFHGTAHVTNEHTDEVLAAETTFTAKLIIKG